MISNRNLQIFSLILGFMAFSLLFPALATTPVPDEPEEGAVVEEATKGWAADRAGLRPGDLLLSWSQENGSRRPVRSSFDLNQLEIEQAPFGVITLHGKREGRTHEWIVPPGAWGLQARPTFPEPLRALYKQGGERIAIVDLEAGVGYWSLAIESADRRKDLLRAAWLQGRVARELASARRWPEADAAWERAIQRLEPLGVSAAQFLREWGEIFWQYNIWERAESCYRSILALEPADSLSAAWDLSALGDIALDRGNLVAAEDLFRKAHAIQERLIPGSLNFAWTLTNLGNVALARGDLSTAEESFRHALNLLERVEPNGTDFTWALAQLGVVDMSRGNLAIAEERFRRALAIQEKLASESQTVAIILNYLGTLAEKRGDLAASEEYHRHALAINEKLAHGSPDATSINRYNLYNLAEVEISKGNLAKADEYLQRLLKIQDSLSPEGFETASTYLYRAIIAVKRGDLVLAEELHGRSLTILDKQLPGSVRVSDNLESLGIIAFKRGDLTKAEELFRRSLAVREKIAPGSTRLGLSLNHLGQVYRRAGRQELAAKYFCRATEAFDRQRQRLGGTTEARFAFGGTMTEHYRDCLSALVNIGQLEKAFLALERGRARSFLDLLAERDLKWTATLPPELGRERKQADAEYDSTQAALGRLSPVHDQAKVDRLLVRLRELRAQQEEIMAKIRLATPQAAALQDPQPINLDGARAALDSGTVLLTWSVGKERTFLFVIQPDGTLGPSLKVFPIAVGDATLRKEVESFRSLLKRPASSRAALQSRARHLYNLLVRPAEEQISKAQRILLSPDGPLHILPFSALMRGDRYLVEWKPIHTVLSVTVYAELKRSRPTRQEPGKEHITVFGDPVYPSVAPDSRSDPELREAVRRGLSLKPLPYTRNEVEAVATLYPQAQVYLGQEATEERAKSVAPKSRLLHFACHGLLDERFPLNSSLALTLPKEQVEGQDNGLLQAWEIFERLRLDADLVTLSACDTALGQEMGGEGLVGLTRAFQYAGARSVLASVWGISDVSTARFMKRFYSYLRSGKTKDEALRTAQIDQIRGKSGSSHPFYWAAFQLTGDWR